MRVLSTLFGLIFGLAFAGGGVLIASQTAVPTFQAWQTMQHWQPTSATLIRVTGFDNDTQAIYRYSFAGKDYQNNRVYLADFKDNIGDYHQTLYHHLRQLKNNGQPVSIWYNPEDPAQAVIDRDMRWGLFALMSGFCSVFILIGLTVCYASLRGDRSKRSRPHLIDLRRQWRQQQAEGQTNETFLDFARPHAERHRQPTRPATARPADTTPWLDRAEWRDNRIRSGAKQALYFIWAFTIVWNAISWPLLLVLEDELNKQNYAVLLLLLFPLVGVFMLIKALRMLHEWRRFGIIVLRLDPFPGSIGGHVGGHLLLKHTRDIRTPYHVSLECVYSYVSGTGDSRSRHETIKWAEQGMTQNEASARGVRLTFRFDVPKDQPEADVKQQGDYYFWRLSLTAEIDGMALNRQYNIPVFATQTQSRYISHDNSVETEKTRTQNAQLLHTAISRGDFASTGLTRAFRYRQRGNQHIFYYPMFRNKGLTLIALIFAAGFDFAAFMINQDFSVNSVVPIVLLIFSLPFALVGLIATLASVYLPFNNLRVTLEAGKISALRRLFLFPVQYHVLHGRDLRNIEIKSSGSTGQGLKRVEHYKLIALGGNKTKFTIAEDLDGKILAGELKDFISRQLGIAAR